MPQMAAKLAGPLLAGLGVEPAVVYVQDARGAQASWHTGVLLKSGKIVCGEEQYTPMKFVEMFTGVKTSRTEQAARCIYLEIEGQTLFDAWKNIDDDAAEGMKQLREQLSAAGVKTFADLNTLWHQVWLHCVSAPWSCLLFCLTLTAATGRSATPQRGSALRLCTAFAGERCMLAIRCWWLAAL